MHQGLSRALLEACDYIPAAERISTAEFAARHRRLNNAGGGHQGMWSNQIVPYATGIMDAFDDPDVSTVAIAGCGQSSKTELAVNYVFRTIVNEPSDVLWYAQTDSAVQSFVKSRFNVMVEDHLELATRLGKRPIDDSVSFKRFRGMNLQFLTATRSNLISKSAPKIIADEVDAYPAELGEVKIQFDVRRQTFEPSSKLLMISHPDLATGVHPTGWQNGIMAVYRDSDRCVWYWPCPACGNFSSPNPGVEWHMALHYPSVVGVETPASLDQVEEEARLVCPHCDYHAADHERRGMNANGRWISSFCEIDAATGVATSEPPKGRTRGFWIVGQMSPFVFGGIGGLARSLAKAEVELEKSGDFSSLKEVYTKQLGIPYAPTNAGGGSVDANTLAERAIHVRHGKGIVPAGVRFITVAVDVQQNRFEYLVRGWGVDSQSWIIDYDQIIVDPVRDPSAWEKVLALYHRTFPLADGSGRRMKVRALVFDSGGAPGVTTAAYTNWKKWKQHGFARRLGSNAGRDVWTIIPSKGVASVTSAPLRVSYPDAQRKDRTAKGLGIVPLMLTNVNTYKDNVLGQIEREAGPNSISFPSWMRSPEPPHKLFEQICSSEIRQPTGKWQRAVAGARNELLDLLVMTHACATLHWLAMIDWSKPPNWCKDWSDGNSMIVSDAVPSDVRDPNKPKTTLEKLMEL